MNQVSLGKQEITKTRQKKLSGVGGYEREKDKDRERETDLIAINNRLQRNRKTKMFLLNSNWEKFRSIFLNYCEIAESINVQCWSLTECVFVYVMYWFILLSLCL